MKNDIVMINIERIYPHPDNPRKNIGEVAELAESIRKKGVMQNMTVIPGHWTADGDWSDNDYTLIIGHRRCAAAKEAGVKEVPCRVVEGLDRKEQISIMLEENMQRSDLTAVEQAEGFQMMLDLGETAESIAEKTGFSKSTVYHRLNIAKLDTKTVREKEESFQLSLKDLIELERIKDVKTRNKILNEASGSDNLRFRIKQEETKRRTEENIQKIIKMAEDAGIKPAPEEYEKQKYTGKWNTLKNIWANNNGGFELPELKKNKEYFWTRSYGSIEIIERKEKEKREKTPEEIKQERIKESIKQAEKIEKTLKDKMDQFIDYVITGNTSFQAKNQETTERIFCLLWKIKGGISFFRRGYIEQTLEDKNSYWNIKEEELDQREEELLQKPLSEILLIAIKDLSKPEVMDYRGKYKNKTAKNYSDIVDFFKEYGFSIDEVEQQLLDGTSELYEVESGDI